MILPFLILNLRRFLSSFCFFLSAAAFFCAASLASAALFLAFSILFLFLFLCFLVSCFSSFFADFLSPFFADFLSSFLFLLDFFSLGVAFFSEPALFFSTAFFAEAGFGSFLTFFAF